MSRNEKTDTISYPLCPCIIPLLILAPLNAIVSQGLTRIVAILVHTESASYGTLTETQI